MLAPGSFDPEWLAVRTLLGSANPARPSQTERLSTLNPKP